MASPASPSLGGMVQLALEQWAAQQKRLLTLERSSEMEQATAALLTRSPEELESEGSVLLKLFVTDIESGLFGRQVVALGGADPDRNLPAHRFSTGDVVGIMLPHAQAGGGRAAAGSSRVAAAATVDMYDAGGVVCGVSGRAIRVALDDSRRGGGSGKAAEQQEPYTPGLGDRVRLDRLVDDVTFKRLSECLADLEAPRHRDAAKLFRILFSTPEGPHDVPEFDAAAPLLTPPADDVTPVPTLAPGEEETRTPAAVGTGLCFSPFYPSLNEGQLRAVDGALRARQLCMIHGPPGTGKTATCVEYIRQEVARGRKVLACGPSNVSVDNLVERLVVPQLAPSSGAAASTGRYAKARRSAPSVVRLGHPARMSPLVAPFSLEALVLAAEASSIVGEVRKELGGVRGSLKRTRDRAERRELRAEEKRLAREVRDREERVVLDIIRGADVVLCTVTGAATKLLQKALRRAAPGAANSGSVYAPFDVVVIDEVAQAVELACYIPALLSNSKLVVAGDHKQLPPTILSEAASRAGLSLTLADRISSKFSEDSGVVHMLTTQYRMNAAIMRWSSEAFYNGRLVAAAAVATHTLRGLPSSLLHSSPYPAVGGCITVRVAAVAAVHAAATAAADSALAEVAESRDAASTSSGKGAGGGAAGGSGGGRATLDTRLAKAVRAGNFVAMAGSGPAGALVAAAADVDVDEEALSAPMLLIDTAGCDLGESVDAPNGSKANVGEADIVVKHILALLAAGVPPADVAVVTPYNAQVGLLNALLSGLPGGAKVEVRSVDGFQGQEKEAIVFSCVRSNQGREVGFLSDFRRINVAVTRARRHFAFIADTETVSADPYLRGLLRYLNEHGVVRSAAEYLPGPHAAVSRATAPCTATRGDAPRAQLKGGSRREADGKRSGDGSARPLREKTDPELLRAQLAAVQAQLCGFIAAVESAVAEGAPTAAGEANSSEFLAMGAAAPERGVFPAARTMISRDDPSPAGFCLRFPSSLNSFQRRVVHLAAEEAGLTHASTGEGMMRVITIRYAPADARRAAVARLRSGGEDALAPASSSSYFATARLMSLLDADGGSEEDGSEEEGEGKEARTVAMEAAPSRPTMEPLAQGGPAVAEAMVSPAPPSGDAASARLNASAISSPAGSPSPSPSAGPAPPPASGEHKKGSAGGKKGHTVGSAPATGSMLASLHAERMARNATGPAGGSAADAAYDSPFDIAIPSTSKGAAAGGGVGAGAAQGTVPSGKKKGKAQPTKLAPTAALHSPLQAGRREMEFGLPVGRVKPVAAPALAGADDDDEMALLEAMVQHSKVCSALKCKTSIVTLSSLCKHCNLRFCIAHGLPEEHGCGSAARSAERQAWLGGAGTASVTGANGSGSKLKDWQRASLSRQLQGTLDEKAAARVQKRTEAKKGDSFK